MVFGGSPNLKKTGRRSAHSSKRRGFKSLLHALKPLYHDVKSSVKYVAKNGVVLAKTYLEAPIKLTQAAFKGVEGVGGSLLLPIGLLAAAGFAFMYLRR